MTIEIVYETHSTSTHNESGIATGSLDGELSEFGRAQARKLGERRRDVDAVFSSDLGRAVETTEIAFAGSGVPVLLDWRLRECNYGELNGMPVAQLEAVRSQHVDEPYPGGESYRQAVDRVRSFLADVSSRFGGRRVLVIGHGATLFALEHVLNGVPLEDLVAAPFYWQEGWEYKLATG